MVNEHLEGDLKERYATNLTGIAMKKDSDFFWCPHGVTYKSSYMEIISYFS